MENKERGQRLFPQIPGPDSGPMDVECLAVFRSGEDWLGVDCTRIERVLPLAYLSRLTFDNGVVLGTVGFHDRLVPVIDLKALLGMGHGAPLPTSSILVSRILGCHERQTTGDDREIGILADAVVDVFFVPTSQIREHSYAGYGPLADSEPDVSAGLSSCADHGIVRGTCAYAGRTITVVEVQGVVEALAVEKLQLHA